MVLAVALVPVSGSDVAALVPVAAAYIAVQLACAVLALRPRRAAVA